MKCCDRPATVNMDHRAGFDEPPIMTVNRMCLKCGHHWYGPEGQVREYTRKEWDAWVNSALDDCIAAPK